MDPETITLERSLAMRATRLGRPTFNTEHARVYQQALLALDEAGIEYLLGGAYALNHWSGIWRDTKDLDVFVRPSDALDALAALRQDGFRTEVVYESWLGKAWVEKVFVDLIWRNANGLFPVSDEWFSRAPMSELLGRKVRTLALEETILSKMMVGNRDRFDGADIMHMLFVSGDKCDWERLARLAGEHIELLVAYLHMYRWGYPAWADKVPPEVVDRYQELAREHADAPREPFRARLLDLPSFRADVEDWCMPDPHKRVLSEIFGDAEGRE